MDKCLSRCGIIRFSKRNWFIAVSFDGGVLMNKTWLSIASCDPTYRSVTIYDNDYLYAAIFDHWYPYVGVSEFRYRSKFFSNIPACPQRFLYVQLYVRTGSYNFLNTHVPTGSWRP